MKKVLGIVCLWFLFGCYVNPIELPQVKEKEVVYVQDHGHSHKEYVYRNGCKYVYSRYSRYADELVYERRDRRRRGCPKRIYIPDYASHSH